MANKNNNVLYLSVTSDLKRRVMEHKIDISKDNFASKYNCRKLVYYELLPSMNDALARQKQLKNWKRQWKNELIEKQNPGWMDLSESWAGLYCQQ